MSDIANYETVVVEKINSTAFIQTVFRLYEDGKIVVLCDDIEHTENLTGFRIAAREKPAGGGGWFEQKHAPIHSSLPAQVSFTSGTEGKPKSIVISHNALADVVERLNTAMSVDATISEYIGVPVTYSFGLGRCRAVSAAGGKFFIPEHGFNPREIADMLAANEINAISAVPSLWKMILANPDVIGKSGRKVKWIEIGSQYMSAPEKAQMKALFPNAVIVQHYGLTEASRTTFLNISKTESTWLESVGAPIGDVEVKISPDNRIMIRGPHVASGRLDEAGRLIKIVDDDGWLTTNDFGHIDQGFLYYDGRADDIINFAGIKVNPDHLERKINEQLDIGNLVAVCRLPDRIRGDGILVAVNDAANSLNRSAIERAVADQLKQLGITSTAGVHIMNVDTIPRTETGKVQRKLLAAQYREPEPATRDSDSVHAIYSSIFSGVTIEPEHTFRQLGGDSLNYVEMSMLLEKSLGQLPKQWDLLSISDLEKLKSHSATTPEKGGWLSRLIPLSEMEMTTFLRTVAILCVVATHARYEIVHSGTLLLFLLIGYNMARFKTDELLSDRRWAKLSKYAGAILVPYYILAVAHAIWSNKISPEIFFLYQNLVERDLTIAFPFWFVQVLIQCLIIFGLLLSIPAIRTYLKKDMWQHSFYLLLIFMAVRLIYPHVWMTDYLNNLVPTKYMALFMLGWCLYYSQGHLQKLMVAACAFITAYPDHDLNSFVWMGVGSLLILYIPHLRVLRFIKDAGHVIATATFYIFIFNGVFIFIAERIIDIDRRSLLFIIGMLGGLSVWYLLTAMRAFYSRRTKPIKQTVSVLN